MKNLLYLGTVVFLTAALLDPVLASGLDRPVPWIRDIVMAILGSACYYLLIKYRKEL